MTDCFDECATARPGISNLTGVMLRAKGLPVNPSIMSEAGDGTVELLVPVLCGLLQNNVKRSASWRARLAVWCSSLTCGSGPADSQNQMPREVRLTAPPNEVASQSQTFSKRVAKQNQPRLTRRLLGGSSGHQGLLFSIDRPPLLAVGRAFADQTSVSRDANPRESCPCTTVRFERNDKLIPLTLQ